LTVDRPPNRTPSPKDDGIADNRRLQNYYNLVVCMKTVRARGLCRTFGMRVAVDDVNLDLEQGEVLGLLGPNGAGKTTVMRLLTGNLVPSAGRIAICGINLLDKPREAKAQIGYLPEIPPLYMELTVDEYLSLAARLHRVEKEKIPTALDNAKRRCGLSNVGNRLIGALSKGYQQRVGIAQAIIHDPAVIIFDEPTAGLDPNQMRDIRLLIRELGAERSVILSTHILSEVESLCDRVQIINEGRVVFGDRINALQAQGTRLEDVFVHFTLRKMAT
jgi:ABC-2 type transport system ATP-binding protein